MWFKLGGQEVEEKDGEETPVPLPIEDRYGGEVTAQDTAEFGLHTGKTEYLKVFKGGEDDVSMKTLVAEMKPTKRMFAIGGGAIAMIAALAMSLSG